MKRISMMSLACLLGVANLLPSSQMYKNVSELTAATLQSNNNFSQTCSNISLSGTVLSALCKMDNGFQNQTSADIAPCAVGTIQNIDGQLACDTGNNCPKQYGKPCCSLPQIPSLLQKGSFDADALNVTEAGSEISQAQVQQLEQQIMEIVQKYTHQQKQDFIQYVHNYSLQISLLEPALSGPTASYNTVLSAPLMAQQFVRATSSKNSLSQFMQQGDGLLYAIETLACCALYLDQQAIQPRLYLPVKNVKQVLDVVKSGDFESAIQALQPVSQQPEPRLGSRMQQGPQWQQMQQQQEQIQAQQEMQQQMQQQILKQRMQQQQPQ